MSVEKPKGVGLGQIMGTLIVSGIYAYLLHSQQAIPGMIDWLFGLAISTLIIGEKGVEFIKKRPNGNNGNSGNERRE